MLLLTFIEYFGASQWADQKIRDAMPMKTRIEAFVTRMELGGAIDWLHDYTEAYKVRYPQLFVEYKLVGVQVIPDISDQQVEKMQMWLVEKIARTAEDFDR